jgi:hypothetical protein
MPDDIAGSSRGGEPLHYTLRRSLWAGEYSLQSGTSAAGLNCQESIVNIEINQAHTGMALSQDVTDLSGHVLIKSGSALTDSHLDLMRAHGIERIEVEEPRHDEIPDSADPAHAQLRLFRNLDHHHPLIRELVRLFRKRQPQPQEDEPDAQ